MHILGILYICLMLGHLLALADIIGAKMQDRRAAKVMDQ